MKLLVALGCVAIACASAQGQTYPNKTIRFVAPFSPGSATDNLARTIAAKLSESWQQPIIVDNKPGASGIIAAQWVARSRADGYTVFISGNTTHAANSGLFKKLPYDPVKDFAPITTLGTVPLALVVHPAVPAKNVQELIAYAKANSGKLSFGAGSTSARMAVEMLKMMANIDILHVPYKSNPEAVTDLIGGQIQLMIADVVTTLPQAKAGKLRALAVSSAKRTPIAPKLPTIAESGLPGYELIGWLAAYVPAGTPKNIVAKLNAELVRILAMTDVKQRLSRMGIDARTSTPAQLAEFQRAETEKWAKLAKAAGVEPE